MNIEQAIHGNDEVLEEKSDMTNSPADTHDSIDSSLLEYESEIYEYLKEAEVRSEH